MPTLSERIDDIKHWYDAAQAVGQYTGYVNPALFKQAILDANDSAFVDALEAQDATLETQAQFNRNVFEKEQRIKIGNKVIATIAQLNEDNSITSQQMDTIFSDADVIRIMQTLQTGSLVTAKALIQALDVTGLAPMDESYKTQCVAIIDDYLGL